MKSWKVCWMSRNGNKQVDHDGIDADAIIVKAADIMEAYKLAIPVVMAKCIAEGSIEYKIYDIGIFDEDVF